MKKREWKKREKKEKVKQKEQKIELKHDAKGSWPSENQPKPHERSQLRSLLEKDERKRELRIKR